MVEEKNQTGSWSRVESVNVIAAAVVAVVVVMMVAVLVVATAVVAVATTAVVVVATMVVVAMAVVMTVFAVVVHPPQMNGLMPVLHQSVPRLLHNTLAYLSPFILLHRSTRIHWEGAWIIWYKPTLPLAGRRNENIR